MFFFETRCIDTVIEVLTTCDRSSLYVMLCYLILQQPTKGMIQCVIVYLVESFREFKKSFTS